MRLSIEISPEQHYQIKAMAALQGKTIKEFVLDKLLPQGDQKEDEWEALRAFIQGRIKEVDKGASVSKSFLEIFQERINAKKSQ